ncbi:MAG: NTP transferase domain-containing protein, partial [Bifidobacteriaceae bacterium]|nr:NTP transferase domain-containing protein [Bifidobacteriaceae bacterium]
MLENAVDNVIILAAGQGTRMKSKTPKVLHKLCGKEIILWLLESVNQINPKKIIVVLQHEAKTIQKFIETEFIKKNKGNISADIKFVMQSDIYGTGQAVKDGLQAIGPSQNSRVSQNSKKFAASDNVLIVPGDTPLLSPETLKKMFSKHLLGGSSATILTAYINNPKGFGRIIKDSDNENKIVKIVEEADAENWQREIQEVNTSVYIFQIEHLTKYINKIESNNAKGELYLTDVIEYMAKNLAVSSVEAQNIYEVLGMNDRVQLAELTEYQYKKIAEQNMLNGVTIIDPKTTYIDSDVEIGKDTIILPGCIIKGPAQIGENCTIGPYSYIRPKTVLSKNAKIGSFVETKNAKIEANSKVPHLSYVGDAEVGSNTNIGAGTIFANYDGENKHFT